MVQPGARLPQRQPFREPTAPVKVRKIPKDKAEKIGKDAQKYAVHAGGQELPMHDSRYEPVLGLAYLVDPTPARHTVANGGLYDTPSLREVFELEGLTPPGRYGYGGKGALFALMNRHIQVVNCAGLCLFSQIMGRPPMREWINAATGWEISLEELLRVGHRVQVLRHVFNLREGINPLTPNPVEQISTGPFRFSMGLFEVIRSHRQIYRLILGFVEKYHHVFKHVKIFVKPPSPHIF